MKGLVVVTVLFAVSCAKIVAPSGGPVDSVPPEIVSVVPDTGYVRKVPDAITIVFSEKVKNPDEDVHIYPDSGWEVKSSGSRITLSRDASEGGLVMVTFTRNLEDMRNNNMESPVTLVWNSIPVDSFAEVSVTVFRDGGGTITSDVRCDFFLYPDSVVPRITCYPDSLGIISAGWLSPGDYRIVCYEDQDRSRRWDREMEPGAVEPVSINPGDSAELSVTMSIADSTGPRISELLVTDSYHFELLWNEQLGTGAGEILTVALTGPDNLPVAVYGVKASQGRSSTGRLTVYTEQLSDTAYSVAVAGVPDLAGNMSLPDTLEFWGTDSLPATRLAIQSAYPENGGIDVPPAGPFYISFTDWVDESCAESLYTVTTVADSTPVPGEFVRTSATSFSFTPLRELLGDRQYRVDFHGGLVSLLGDTVSSRSWTFVPAWSEQPGSISGTVTGTTASVVTIVVSPAGGDGEVLAGNFSPGSYIFREIPGGRYTVSVFVDLNSDGTWTPGEPYGAWPGVVEVLPGIDTDSVAIQVVP
jgi:hypothetical protein